MTAALQRATDRFHMIRKCSKRIPDDTGDLNVIDICETVDVDFTCALRAGCRACDFGDTQESEQLVQYNVVVSLPINTCLLLCLRRRDPIGSFGLEQS
jgi:hypothetical protein